MSMHRRRPPCSPICGFFASSSPSLSLHHPVRTHRQWASNPVCCGACRSAVPSVPSLIVFVVSFPSPWTWRRAVSIRRPMRCSRSPPSPCGSTMRAGCTGTRPSPVTSRPSRAPAWNRPLLPLRVSPPISPFVRRCPNTRRCNGYFSPYAARCARRNARAPSCSATTPPSTSPSSMPPRRAAASNAIPSTPSAPSTRPRSAASPSARPYWRVPHRRPGSNGIRARRIPRCTTPNAQQTSFATSSISGRGSAAATAAHSCRPREDRYRGRRFHQGSCGSAMNEQPPSVVVVGEIASHWEAELEEMHLPDVRRAAALSAIPTLCAARPADVILLIAVQPSSFDPAIIKNLRQQDAAQGRYTCMVQCISAEQINVVPMQLIAGTNDILLHSVDVRGLSRRLALFGRIAALETQLLHFKRQVPPNELLLQDRLTGLGNWRYLTNHLENLLHETRDRGGLVCCALLSGDRLNYITKHYGQAVRSELLRGIAMRLRKTLRPTAVVARPSGNEFGVALRSFDYVHARRRSVSRCGMAPAGAPARDNRRVPASARIRSRHRSARRSLSRWRDPARDRRRSRRGATHARLAEQGPRRRHRGRRPPP